MSLASDIKANLRLARFNRREIAGSLGDLGTFLPLLVAMSARNGLDFATGLFFAGLMSVLTGLLFSVPLAVQPMKAIAAVALTEGLTVPQIVAAGAIVSLAVLILGLTGLIDTVNRLIPRPVVRGIQLSLGLSLTIKGLQMIGGTQVLAGPDSYLTAAISALIVLALVFRNRVPAALVLFGAGIVIAILQTPDLLKSLGIGLWHPTWQPPGLDDFKVAGPKAALPQLPLTTLNSVVAVCILATDLFPDRKTTPRAVSTSVGIMNLVGVWFGAMPMCHGAGGLAGQYKFGARSNGAILFLGVSKMALAVIFGGSLMALCAAFPASILGVMLAFSGLELALVARDQSGRTDAFVMLLTAGAAIGLNNMAIGFAFGLAAALLLRTRFFAVEGGDRPAS